MMITFVQRSLIIFAILLCCYQSWVGAVDCEQEPYNPACRGSQARKRLTPLPVMRSGSLNCDDGDCRFPGMKILIAILDPSSRDNEVHQGSNSVHARKGRMRIDESKDVYMDDY